MDEEGGKVSRLGKIINHEFSQKLFGDLYKENKNLGLTFYKNYLKYYKSFENNWHQYKHSSCVRCFKKQHKQSN